MIRNAKHMLLMLFFMFNIYGKCQCQKIVDDLVNMNKVYSILKYSYPIKNYKNFDWDALLVDMTDEVIKLKNNEEIISVLDKYLRPIFKNILITKTHIVNFNSGDTCSKFFMYDNFGDGIDAEKSGLNNPTYKTSVITSDENILSRFTTVKISDSLFLKFSFPSSIVKINYIQKHNIRNFERINNLSCRIATVLKLYSVINCFYPRNSFDRTEFKQAYKDAIIKSFDNFTYQDYSKIVDSFLSILNDGHAQYFFTFSGKYGLVGRGIPTYYPKFKTKICNTKIYIESVVSSSFFKLNDQIIKINNISDTSLIDETLKLVSANTINHKLYKANNLLFKSFKKDSIIELTINRNDSIILCNVVTNNKYSFVDSRVEIEPIIFTNDSFAVIDFTSKKLKVKLIKKNVDLLNSSKGIIFKLTGYPNYNSGEILACFTDKILISPDFVIENRVGLITNPVISQTSENWKIYPKGLVKNKYLFISEYTASWGETLLDIIKYNKLGLVLGKPSFDSNGDILNISLPIGSFFMTGLKVERNNQEVGSILPDVYIDYPYGCSYNFPEYLEKAKSLILQYEK